MNICQSEREEKTLQLQLDIALVKVSKLELIKSNELALYSSAEPWISNDYYDTANQTGNHILSTCTHTELLVNSGLYSNPKTSSIPANVRQSQKVQHHPSRHRSHSLKNPSMRHARHSLPGQHHIILQGFKTVWHIGFLQTGVYMWMVLVGALPLFHSMTDLHLSDVYNSKHPLGLFTVGFLSLFFFCQHASIKI